MILIILVLSVIILLFLLKNKYEHFEDKTKEIKYIFDTNLFDNKTVFLIANNSKLSDKTKNFLKNYNYNNSIIVRFNGLKPFVKDYCNGKTDVMIYRKAGNSFHGINSFSKDFINVFTNDTDNIKKDVKDGYYIKKNLPKQLKNRQENPNYIMLTEKFFVKNKKFYYTTGFQALYSLLQKNKFKKIYMIGFTFRNGKITNWHNETYERDYYNKNIKNNKNIELLI